MTTIHHYITRYKQQGLACFPLRLAEEFSEKHDKWKKQIDAPSKWQDLENSSGFVVETKHNAIGILTGKKSGIFVLDIDVVQHWIEWLKSHERYDDWIELEKTLVTVRTASGGSHFYFLFTENLAQLKGTSKCFGGHWEIDSRTSGNFVYAPPTCHVTENVDWKYTWVRSIFDYPLVEMPDYIVNWLVTRPGREKSARIPTACHASSSVNFAPPTNLRSSDFHTDSKIEAIIKLIEMQKWDEYNFWLALGSYIKSLTLPEKEKLRIYKSASQNSEGYKTGCVEMRWNGLKVNDAAASENTLKIWARQSNPREYANLTGETIIENDQMNTIREFVSSRFRLSENRVLDGIVKNYDDTKYIVVNIDETYCKIHGGEHDDLHSFEGKEIRRASNPYVVIGLEHARLKCHNSLCRAQSKTGETEKYTIKSAKYPKTLKSIVDELLTVRTVATRSSSAEPVLQKSYEVVKEQFESKWFYLKHPTSFVEVTAQDTYYLKIADFRLNEGLLSYEDISTIKGVKQISDHPFVERWLKDPTKRIYEKEDFLPPPLSCPAEVYNLYRGIRAANLPKISSNSATDMTPILEFLAHLCGESQSDDKKGTAYFINWLANILQLPGTLPGVAVVIQSPQGCGKNLFGSFFGRKVLGGKLYESSAKIDTFFSTFAEGLSQKLLINFNEVDGNLTKKHLGEIKEAITDERIALERKNFQRVFIQNFARHLWFTNNTKPIHIEASDRRFVAFKIETIPERAYFKALAKWMDDDENVRAFYDFLMVRDLSSWDPVDDRPKTAYYTALKRMSLSLVDSWLIHEMEARSLPQSISFLDMMKRFNDWATGVHKQHQSVSVSVFSPLMEPYQDYGLFKKKSREGRTFRVDLTLLQEKFVADDKIDPPDSAEYLDDD